MSRLLRFPARLTLLIRAWRWYQTILAALILIMYTTLILSLLAYWLGIPMRQFIPDLPWPEFPHRRPPHA